MIIDQFYRFGDGVAIGVDTFPGHHPTFELQSISSVAKLVEQLKDKLRELNPPPENPPEDPFTDKFAELQQKLIGLDIGDL